MRARVVSVNASEQVDNFHSVLDYCWTNKKGVGSSRHSHHKYGQLKCIFCSVVSLRRISPSVSYEVISTLIAACTFQVLETPTQYLGRLSHLCETKGEAHGCLLTCMSCSQCGSWVSKLFVESCRLARPWPVGVFVQRVRGSEG
jgi:hypothetical protein